MPDDRGHILIVEDNPTDRDLAVRELLVAGGIGHPLDVTANATEALAAIGRAVPIVALIDLTLPGMDGLALIREIRTKHDGEQLPVIIVTGSSEPKTRDDGLAAGANGIIVKPLDFHKLSTEMLRLGRKLYFWKPADAHG